MDPRPTARSQPANVAVVRARLRAALRPALLVVWMALALGLLQLVLAVLDHGLAVRVALAVALVLVQMSAPFLGGAAAYGLCRELLDGSTRPLRKRWLMAVVTALAGAATFLVARALIVGPPPVEEWAPVLFFAGLAVIALRFSRVTRV